jgi:hypothetical protein
MSAIAFGCLRCNTAESELIAGLMPAAALPTQKHSSISIDPGIYGDSTTTLPSAIIAQLASADPVFAAPPIDLRLVFLGRASAC